MTKDSKVKDLIPMKLLIISPISPKDPSTNSRACIYARDLVWLHKISIASGDHFLVNVIGMMSQSHEIMVDPDNLMGHDQVVNQWLADYCSPFSGDILFKFEDVLELTQTGDEWVEQGPWVHDEDPRHPVFSSSYGGDGIRLTMRLTTHGLRIMQNRTPQSIALAAQKTQELASVDWAAKHRSFMDALNKEKP